MTDDELKEIEEVLDKMDARQKNGEVDPHLIVYMSIKENGKFDTKEFFERVAESIAYDGPERRGATTPTVRLLREVRGLPGGMGKGQGRVEVDSRARASTKSD